MFSLAVGRELIAEFHASWSNCVDNASSLLTHPSVLSSGCNAEEKKPPCPLWCWQGAQDSQEQFAVQSAQECISGSFAQPSHLWLCWSFGPVANTSISSMETVSGLGESCNSLMGWLDAGCNLKGIQSGDKDLSGHRTGQCIEKPLPVCQHQHAAPKPKGWYQT